jgi:hypothetical protein
MKKEKVVERREWAVFGWTGGTHARAAGMPPPLPSNATCNDPAGRRGGGGAGGAGWWVVVVMVVQTRPLVLRPRHRQGGSQHGAPLQRRRCPARPGGGCGRRPGGRQSAALTAAMARPPPPLRPHRAAAVSAGRSTSRRVGAGWPVAVPGRRGAGHAWRWSEAWWRPVVRVGGFCCVRVCGWRGVWMVGLLPVRASLPSPKTQAPPHTRTSPRPSLPMSTSRSMTDPAGRGAGGEGGGLGAGRATRRAGRRWCVACVDGRGASGGGGGQGRASSSSKEAEEAMACAVGGVSKAPPPGPTQRARVLGALPPPPARWSAECEQRRHGAALQHSSLFFARARAARRRPRSVPSLAHSRTRSPFRHDLPVAASPPGLQCLAARR